MNKKIDVLPLFKWAVSNGEATIIDRILMKNMLSILKYDTKITKDNIQNSAILEIDEILYELIKKSTQELVGSSYRKVQNV